jgi:Domain of unknown function (DUF1918)
MSPGGCDERPYRAPVGTTTLMVWHCWMEVLNVTPGVPNGELPSADGPVLRAEVGDTLVIDSGGMAGLPRIGTIIAVTGQDGSPPYMVRWLAGEYESRILPGAGARVEKHLPAPRCSGD